MRRQYGRSAIGAIGFKQPTNDDICINDERYSSNLSSRPYLIVARASKPFIGGASTRMRRINASFSSGLGGAAAVSTSRSSCSSEWPSEPFA